MSLSCDDITDRWTILRLWRYARAEANSAIQKRTTSSAKVPFRSRWTDWKHEIAQIRTSRPLTSKVTSEHEIQNKKTVLIILKSVSEINDKWMVYLIQNKPRLLCHWVDPQTSSSNRRSCMMLATAFCLIHRDLSMYLRAYSFFVFLCSTTLTCGAL